MLCHTIKLPVSSERFSDSKYEAFVKGHHRLTHVKKTVLLKLGRKGVKSEWDAEAYVDNKKKIMIFGDSPFYPDLNSA